VEPHRPGSYASEFHLHDSLKLMLDSDYNLQLREKKGRIVSSCRFRYEDYELHGNKIEVQLSTSKQFHPAKNELSITATDANGLILKDARASIVVKTQTIREAFEPISILPDTLLFSEINLKADGATIVDIPSHLFHKTNTTYLVHVSVMNSQNQRMEQTLTADYYFSQFELTAHFVKDSIIYEMLNNGVPVKDVAVKLKHNDEVEAREVRLPFKEKINPVIYSVRLQGDVASKEIVLRNLIPEIKLEGGIQKDSFNILLHNPQKLDVSWYIYQGSQLLQKGFGKELEYKSIVTDRTQTFYVELLYSFGGQDNIKRKDYEFKEDYLNVSLNVPERVYPGQRAEASIKVTDQLGNPVNGVDLTAMAVTSKLNYDLPDLPYYGSSSTPRSQKAHYSKRDVSKRTAILDLDYKRWEKRAALDTMKYYQFIYPQKIFKHTIDIADSTQFAPYVMQNGQAKQIYVIELDRKPVYFSWADQPASYSFYVSQHRTHEISLRLHDRVLVIDSMEFAACKKTIFSIDLDHLPKGTKVYTFDPIYKPLNKRRYKKYYAFTDTEITRHMLYLSYFTTTVGNAYLEYGKEFTPLFSAQFPSRKDKIIVGPATPGLQTFTNRYRSEITYRHHGGYTYNFEGNVVYKLTATDLMPNQLYNNFINPMASVNDLAVTKESFTRFIDYSGSKWRTRAINLVDHESHVNILLPDEQEDSGIAALLFQNCKTKNVVSPCRNPYGSSSDFFTIPRGCYHAIVLYNNGKYLKSDNIDLKSYHHVLIDFNQSVLHPKDSLSRIWLTIAPANNCYGPPPIQKAITMRNAGTFNGNVRGTIYDETNLPLPGVNIVIKGTASGTAADVDGKFSLDIEESTATLVISFIGYVTQEIDVQIGSDITINLVPDISQLSEVIVIGYGTQSKHDLTGSVSSMSGVTAPPDSGEDTENESAPEDKNIQDAERRLYQELLTLSTIRSKFSDVGFWEPKLFTDKRGESKFNITFPDDITKWNATVYAMNKRLQTGTVRKSIKSYKPLMAELNVPQFLTRGDSAFFMGKVLNYSHEKNITGKVKWNGAQTGFEKSIQFTEFHMDKLPVHAATLDSITTSYRFTRDDGYLDGEERTVPVVEQGVIRAEGTLSILKNDEDVHISATGNEKVKIEILSSQLDIYAGEVTYLLNYKYACNEQLASKLLGLINHKMLMQFEGEPFKYDKDVNKIITRLLKNQNQEFLWSWWDVSASTSYWMSAHILRALKAASDAGYKVNLDIDNIIHKAEYKFEFLHEYSLSDIDLLHALAGWNAKLNYPKYIAKLDSLVQEKQRVKQIGSFKYYYPYSLLKEKLLLQETRQVTNVSYQRDSVLFFKKEGIMGDIHFDDNKPKNYWYGDALATNVIAYRILRRDSILRHLLVPMQMYFLSQRRQGAWNTYHSSNVLTSVLPDLIAEGASKKHQASITLTGKVNAVIEKFPYHLDLSPADELTIHKDSGLPLYCMQYVNERVTNAKTGVEGFKIKTTLGDDKMILTAGKPVALTVEVELIKDASAAYVMIEVPIPGACSYADKTQVLNRIETHREYFKDRTVIFCENMKQGKYTFVVHLLPRFTGKYLINPAQVSLMYVPVVNANTNMKTVTVE
jgi:alpha-2-macroglobulin